jgi:hypothetical protein
MTLSVSDRTEVMSLTGDIFETTATDFDAAITPVSEANTTPVDDKQSESTTETRAQEQKKKEDGCMKIFAIILQVVAAVVAVVVPGGAAISAALLAASKALMPKEESAGSSSNPVDVNGIQRRQQAETDRLTEQYESWLAEPKTA